MAAKKRTKATEAPAINSKATATPTATSTATATLPLSPLPLQHYLARVPLQLAAIIFCLYTSADKKSFPSSPPTQRTISSLVQDPTAFLLTACTSMLVVQAWFGNWARGCRKAAEQAEKEEPKAATSKQQQQGKKGFSGAFKDMWSDAKQGKAPHKKLFQQEGKQAPSLDFLNLKHLGPAAITTGIIALVLHACAVLLGAPLLSRFPETLLLSLLVSILAITPLAIAIPIQERYVWQRLFSSVDPSNDLEIALLAPALGALVGAWAGAIPIPLDWDRPWQAWPTTCVLGAVGGHAIGSLVSLGVCSYNTSKRSSAVAQ